MLMGTGPYMLRDPEAWRPGSDRVIRNERYWGRAGPFNRIVYNEVIEEVAALTMFRNGSSTGSAAQPDEYVELLKDPKIRERANHFEVQSPLSGTATSPGTSSATASRRLFADKRVRPGDDDARRPRADL
jgi:ABC-type transport system substrate-binding protein